MGVLTSANKFIFLTFVPQIDLEDGNLSAKHFTMNNTLSNGIYTCKSIFLSRDIPDIR